MSDLTEERIRELQQRLDRGGPFLKEEFRALCEMALRYLEEKRVAAQQLARYYHEAKFWEEHSD